VRRSCLGWALVLPALVLAATGAQDRKAALKGQQAELREKLESVRRDLAKSEETGAYAADQLKEIETAISAANRGLHELVDQRRIVEAQARELATESQRLDRQIHTQQNQLSGLLYRQFVHGEADSLQLLLAGRDPNQAALDHQFLKHLSMAKADLIADLRAKTAEQKRLAASAREKADELVAILRQQQQARADLLAQQKARQLVLARTTDKIKAQRREIGALQRDEKRLGRLIEGLARIVPRRHKGAAAPTGNAPQTVPRVGVPAPDPAHADGAFAALRGRLPWPAKGTVAARFGKPRPEGGTTWKGLLIRAPEGAEVMAIAAGEVVYAE
jgi:septal ring factor EnvC (AmiA/AmiB activator)